MTDTDYAIREKLQRAVTHLQALHRTIDRFLKSNAYSIANDFHSEPGYLIVKATARRQPPKICRVLIGDFLYNTRAALDYTACDLARFNDEPVDEHVEFPIFKDKAAYRNPSTGNITIAIKNRIGLLRPEHQAIIEEEQPFQGRRGTPEDDPLWLLYRLSNYDRHQFLHLTSIITKESFHDFSPPEAATRFEQVSVRYGAFESDTEVARFRILPGPEIDVHVDSQIRFDIGFDEKGPGAGRPVLYTLGDILVRVPEIIKRLGQGGAWPTPN